MESQKRTAQYKETVKEKEELDGLNTNQSTIYLVDITETTFTKFVFFAKILGGRFQILEPEIHRAS